MQAEQRQPCFVVSALLYFMDTAFLKSEGKILHQKKNPNSFYCNTCFVVVPRTEPAFPSSCACMRNHRRDCWTTQRWPTAWTTHHPQTVVMESEVFLECRAFSYFVNFLHWRVLDTQRTQRKCSSICLRPRKERKNACLRTCLFID